MAHRIAGCFWGAAWLLLAAPAVAAPFCVTVQGVPDQCVYVDGAECQKRAQQQGGVCTANSKEIRTPPGPGAFCLAAGGHVVSCNYADRQSCLSDAMRQHTACIQATEPPSASIDPFAARRPY